MWRSVTEVAKEIGDENLNCFCFIDDISSPLLRGVIRSIFLYHEMGLRT